MNKGKELFKDEDVTPSKLVFTPILAYAPIVMKSKQSQINEVIGACRILQRLVVFIMEFLLNN